MNKVSELFEAQIANFKALSETAINTEEREFAERQLEHLKIEYKYWLEHLAKEAQEREENAQIVMDEDRTDFGYSLNDLSEEEIQRMIDNYMSEIDGYLDDLME